MVNDAENRGNKSGCTLLATSTATKEQVIGGGCESSCCGSKSESTGTRVATDSTDAAFNSCSPTCKLATSPTCALGFDSCCSDSEAESRCTEDCALAFARYECSLPAEHNEERLPPSIATITTFPTAKENDFDQHRDRLRAAFDKYAAMVQKAVCLCRNVPSSNTVRCCARKPSRESTALEKGTGTRRHQFSESRAQRDKGCKSTKIAKENFASEDACCEGDRISGMFHMEAYEMQETVNRCKRACCGNQENSTPTAAQCQQTVNTHEQDCCRSENIPATIIVENHKPNGTVHDCNKSRCASTNVAHADILQAPNPTEAVDVGKKGCSAVDSGRSGTAMGTVPDSTICYRPDMLLPQEYACCKRGLCEIVPTGMGSGVGEHACQDSCCDSEPGLPSNQVTSAQLTRKTDTDIESEARPEDVVVNVRGMTCTGCESKLATALATIDGVSQVRVMFVSGRAEFKIDTSVASTPSIISHLQARTGFQITQVHPDLASLDFLIPKHVSIPVAETLPAGANDVERISPRLVRVFYDPSRIKARSLVAALKGQSIVLAPTNNPGKEGNEKHIAILALKTLFAIGLTIPVCVLAWAKTELSEHVKGATSLGLATLVQGIAVSEFYWNAFRSLYRNRTLELDMLVVISVTAAYTYSVVAFSFLTAGQPLAVKEFFETSTLLISLVLLGRLIAGFARVRAVASVSLRSFQTTSVTILCEDGSKQGVDSRLLHFGDIFQVPPHTRIATDGTIVSGESEIDESVVTGESIPIARGPGSCVVAGSINGSGRLQVKVNRLPGKNTLTDIAELVEAAHSSKPRVQSLADVLAGYFIAVVLVIALIVFIVWIPISMRFRGLAAPDAVVSAVTYAVAVLAVSCPCALGLAVPMVLVVTGGIAARHGIIIKSASATERAWSITDVVFDKTGTLTLEELEVCHAVVFDGYEKIAFPATLALSKDNNHPVSRSVAAYISSKSIKALDLPECRSLPGRGIVSKCDDTSFRVGNPKWLQIEEHPAVKQFYSQNFTVLCTTRDKDVLAIFALRSTIRPEAHGVISQLHARGLTTHLLSGDTDSAVQQIGHALSIKHVQSRQSPKDKGAYVDAITSDPRRRVLFCGDGTNDAVAVARAHVGVSIGIASDVTAGSADVTLLGSLEGVVGLLDLSKAAFRRIVFNFVWSGVYNVFAILLAAGAFVVVRLPPAYAGLGELVSVLPVIAVAMTMLLRICKK